MVYRRRKLVEAFLPSWTGKKLRYKVPITFKGPFLQQQVKNAVVLRKNRRGKPSSLGCGVVEFDSASVAQYAVSVLNESELDGRTIKCREDRLIEESFDETNLQYSSHEEEASHMLSNLSHPLLQIPVPEMTAPGYLSSHQQQQQQHQIQLQQQFQEEPVDVEESPAPAPQSRSRRNRKSRRGGGAGGGGGGDEGMQDFAGGGGEGEGGTAAEADVDEVGEMQDPFRIFVSSLAWETTKEGLANFFSGVGEVESAEVTLGSSMPVH